ncbi:MAG TPA: toll/interleukin-1 receptor domain-containing protein [Allosphingosinicella sp.]|jgi:tetratricopeptide (TPR) repeat protein
MAEAGPGAAGRYVAFISYSHKDAAMGRWLHRKLEGYRLPKRLAGTEGENGTVPERLTPIFRDRDELPAAGDLSEKVRAALAVSRNLIILCSPDSAVSPWVAKEIATFRELHPDRPIFTAIARGEPEQCFPQALREGGVEPLAADLRKEGDGRHLGLLKLVAALSGVGLDALVQRDATRRIRRVTWVTAAAVAGMLAMALLTAIALNARAEAQRQRVQAEGLVEFMLTDLRDKLKGVGRLDVITTVSARALTYYGVEQKVERLPDESLGRRARVLQAIGDDNLELGHLSRAFEAFMEARATTSELVSRAPHDGARLFDHAKSLSGIGQVHERRREWKAAERYYSALEDTADRLRAMSPSNTDYLMKAASAAVNLGNLRFKLADSYPFEEQSAQYVMAGRYYAKAVRLFDRAVSLRPRDPHALMAQANAFAWLADSYFMRKEWERSLDARFRQYRIMDGLGRSDPSNADYSYHLAVARFGVARSLAELGRRSEARMQLFEADRLTNDLIRRDACNADWLSFRIKLDNNLLVLGLGLPPGTTRSQLRKRIDDITADRRRLQTSNASNCRLAA